MLQSVPPFQIQSYKYKQEYSKTPERRASITEEWKRYSYYRYQSHGHTYIYEYVHEETTCNAVAVDLYELVFLTFGENNKAYYQEHVEGDDR